MKKILLVLFAIVLVSSFAYPQTRARIKVEHVTPSQFDILGTNDKFSFFGIKSNPQPNLRLLFCTRYGAEGSITTSTFELVSKPGGSTAALEVLASPHGQC